MRSKDLFDRRAEPPDSIDDAEEAFAEVNTTHQQVLQQAFDRLAVLGRRLDKAQRELTAIERDAEADDDLLGGQRLAVNPEGRKSSSSNGRSSKASSAARERS